MISSNLPRSRIAGRRGARRRRSASLEHQGGAVLMLGLIVLLVVTLIGLTSEQTTVMQERMSGNLLQSGIALQAAETALQTGLAYIERQTSPPTPDASGTSLVWTSCTVAQNNADRSGGGDDPCTRLDGVLENWAGPLDDVDAGASYADVIAALGESGALPGVIAQPRIYIEVREVPSSTNPMETARAAGVYHYYTVTALGFGAATKARAIVQSTVAKVYAF